MGVAGGRETLTQSARFNGNLQLTKKTDYQKYGKPKTIQSKKTNKLI
jgi:hypothetical protein